MDKMVLTKIVKTHIHLPKLPCVFSILQLPKIKSLIEDFINVYIDHINTSQFKIFDIFSFKEIKVIQKIASNRVVSCTTFLLWMIKSIILKTTFIILGDTIFLCMHHSL